ncbi:MAG TPA: hypothetical protein VNR18_00730, partial [Hyphomicrobiales bacterium]|nr:hypothetical protein [Hyphomicrobiales bacterium]
MLRPHPSKFRRRRRMKSRLSIALLHLFSWLPLPLMRALGALCGAIIARLDTRMARTTHTNLALVFPELTAAERQALARASLRNSCQMLFEAAGTWLWPAPRAL